MKYTKEQFAKFMDHSALKPYLVEKDIIRMAREAKEWGFAALSVNPIYTKVAARELEGTDIEINPCISFPFGAIPSQWKAWEAEKCLEEGATEIDMVANIGAIREEKWNEVREDIKAVVEVAGNIKVKVIIETAYLNDFQKKKAAVCVADAGASFVKTSTGYASAGANLHDVLLLFKTVGDRIQVKAAGGIRHFEDALAFINAGASRLASSSSIQIMQEGGFSRKE
ncbi:MAG: deoxyribose-phosphate aldolase [Candidatus Hodarchaeales archaeon]